MILYRILYEPRCKKIGLRGFRPDPTQTGLYNNIRPIGVDLWRGPENPVSTIC